MESKVRIGDLVSYYKLINKMLFCSVNKNTQFKEKMRLIKIEIKISEN
jgi:hypothetical protein